MTSNLSGFTQVTNGPTLYIHGITISNNATTPNTKVDVSAGICRDQSNTLDLNIGQFGLANDAITINAAVVGVNGLDTGTLQASKVYNVYVIADTSGNNETGAILSLTAEVTGPIMPYGYNAYRLVGYMVTDASSHFLLCYNSGTSNSRTFTYDAPQATSITAGNATSYTGIVLTTLVPAVSNLQVSVNTAFTPGAASRTLSMHRFGSTGDQVTVTGQVTSVVVNTSSNVLVGLNGAIPTIAYKVSNSGDAVAINIAGFRYSV